MGLWSFIGFWPRQPARDPSSPTLLCFVAFPLGRREKATFSTRSISRQTGFPVISMWYWMRVRVCSVQRKRTRLGVKRAMFLKLSKETARLSLKWVKLHLGAQPAHLCAGAPLHYTYAHSESGQRIINEGESNGKKLRDKGLPIYVCVFPPLVELWAKQDKRGKTQQFSHIYPNIHTHSLT